jgi:hypothetical protein
MPELSPVNLKPDQLPSAPGTNGFSPFLPEYSVPGPFPDRSFRKKGPRQISAHRPIARFKPFLAFLIPKAMIFSAFDGLATWFPRRNPLFTGVH